MNGTLICKNCEISKIQKNEMVGKDGSKIEWYQCLYYQNGDMSNTNIVTVKKEAASAKIIGQYVDVVIAANEDKNNNKITKFKIIDFLKDGKSVVNIGASLAK